MDRVKLGLYIAALRKQKGMTQKDLAEQLHVSVPAISKWERGLNFPDIISLQPLAEILGVSLAELFTQSPEKELPESKEFMEDLLTIAMSNSLREQKEQKKQNIVISVLTVILLLLAAVQIVMVVADREAVFKVVATGFETSEEGLRIFEMYVTSAGNVSHDDIRQHMDSVDEKWRAGVYADGETDAVHIRYYNSPDIIKIDTDNYFYETYIFK